MPNLVNYVAAIVLEVRFLLLQAALCIERWPRGQCEKEGERGMREEATDYVCVCSAIWRIIKSAKALP